VDILVAPSLDYGRETLLRHTHKGMRVGARAHSIDGNGDAERTVRRPRSLTLLGISPAICTVLEPDGEGDTRSKLAVKL